MRRWRPHATLRILTPTRPPALIVMFRPPVLIVMFPATLIA